MWYKLVKRGFTPLPPLRCSSQQKNGEGEEGSATVRVAPYPRGEFLFYTYFSLIFEKINPVILAI